MDIRGSAGTADITPQRAVPLFGSVLRTAAFQGVADPLEANAVVLWDGDVPLVLITVDLAFVGRELRSGVMERLGGVIPEESVFFAASHTHFAPATDARRPRLGQLSEDYLAYVSDRVFNLVSRLLQQTPQPLMLDYIEGKANHAINRRLRTPWHLSRRGLLLNAVVGAPNPLGPRDETLHLVRLFLPTGRYLAAIWSYACHPVGFPRPLEVSADYPGRVRKGLRAALGSEVPVLFWQGFAGDVRPPELDRSTSLGRRTRRLLLGPRFGRFTVDEWNSWAESLADRVTGLIGRSQGAPLAGRVQRHRITRPLGDFVAGVTDEREVTFHAVTIGESMAVVGVSAEVVSDYGPVVRRYFADRRVIPVGYIDEVYGYLPTARMLGEGGYEVEWFLEAFGLEGHLHPELELHCHSALQELAAGLVPSSSAPHV